MPEPERGGGGGGKGNHEWTGAEGYCPPGERVLKKLNEQVFPPPLEINITTTEMEGKDCSRNGARTTRHFCGFLHFLHMPWIPLFPFFSDKLTVFFSFCCPCVSGCGGVGGREGKEGGDTLGPFNSREEAELIIMQTEQLRGLNKLLDYVGDILPFFSRT